MKCRSLTVRFVGQGGPEPEEWYRCEYCNAKPLKPRDLTVSMTELALVCSRGFGCARRRPEHERKRGGHREFLLDGHWYTIGELAALASQSRQTIHSRIKHGWPMEAVIGGFEKKYNADDYRTTREDVLRRLKNGEESVKRSEFNALVFEHIKKSTGCEWHEVRDRPWLDQVWNDLLDAEIKRGQLTEAASRWTKPWDKRKRQR